MEILQHLAGQIESRCHGLIHARMQSTHVILIAQTLNVQPTTVVVSDCSKK
jgi:hypothetical protein